MLVRDGSEAVTKLPEGVRGDREAVAEAIENNIRRVILDESPVNPKYYGEMSELLDALIERRRQEALDYEAYLQEVTRLARRVADIGDSEASDYPDSLDTPAARSLYDNLGKDEALALRVDTAVRCTKKDSWIGHRIKEREMRAAIRKAIGDRDDIDPDTVLELVKNQHEYK